MIITTLLIGLASVTAPLTDKEEAAMVNGVAMQYVCSQFVSYADKNYLWGLELKATTNNRGFSAYLAGVKNAARDELVKSEYTFEHCRKILPAAFVNAELLRKIADHHKPATLEDIDKILNAKP